MTTHSEEPRQHVRQLRAALPLKLAHDGERFIRLNELVVICDVGKSYVNAAMAAGTFPKCVHLPGGKVVAWRSSDIERWMGAVVERSMPIAMAGAHTPPPKAVPNERRQQRQPCRRASAGHARQPAGLPVLPG